MTTCANCRFFDAKEMEMTLHGVPAGPPIKNHGFCRHRSPTLTDSRGFARFPILHQTEWCGDFADKVLSK